MTISKYEELLAKYPKAFQIMPQHLIDKIIESPETPDFTSEFVIKLREYYLALVKFESPCPMYLSSLDAMGFDIMDFVDELIADPTITNVNYTLENDKYIITYDRVANV